MKIRTKLLALLSGLLLLSVLATTLGGYFLLKNRVETSAKQDAQATAREVANNLEDYLQTERTDDELGERVESLRRRHPSVATLSLSLVTDEGEMFEVVLPQGGDVEVSHPRGERKRRPRSERAQLHDARRALWDHGESLRPPASRYVEPLFRVGDRGLSTRWSRYVPTSVASRRIRDIKSREDSASCEPRRCISMSTPLDPVGPQRGTLHVTVYGDRYNSVIRDQVRISALTGILALVLLLLASTWIVDRVVARPVSELERAMHEVEQGDLRRRVATARKDEVGNLGRGFNAMLDRLAQADDEIRALNSRLADDIATATKDLKRKNEALDQLNQLLFQAQRELGDKERLAALGQLAAQLAHEIGTPLASVSGHLQLATYGREVSAPVRERLQLAIGELGRVSQIIRDYLDQTRAAKPTPVPTDLRRVVEEAVRVASSAVRRPGVRIQSDVDPDAATIETDAGLLRQVLINLISNALDASAARMAPSGASAALGGGVSPPRSSPALGKVQVTVRPGSPKREDAIEVAVQDDGIGIAAEDLVRIFEPFYTTKGRGKGTGLGLAICRELTRSLGGKISVSSEPGHGSTFSVMLPRKLTRV